jgi:hypothetical protein
MMVLCMGAFGFLILRDALLRVIRAVVFVGWSVGVGQVVVESVVEIGCKGWGLGVNGCPPPRRLEM